MYIATFSRDCSNEEEPLSPELEFLTIIPMSEDVHCQVSKSRLYVIGTTKNCYRWMAHRENVPEMLKKLQRRNFAHHRL